jgi:hypothetical protein
MFSIVRRTMRRRRAISERFPTRVFVTAGSAISATLLSFRQRTPAPDHARPGRRRAGRRAYRCRQGLKRHAAKRAETPAVGALERPGPEHQPQHAQDLRPLACRRLFLRWPSRTGGPVQGRPPAGQACRYIGWVGENLAQAGQKVIGIICVHERSEKLRLAVSALPSLAVFEYTLTFERI